MTNVIKLPVDFKPSYSPIPVNKTLLSADKEDLDEVIVLGYKNGEVKIFSSETEVSKVIFLCEYAKALITKSVIGELYLDVK